MILRRVVEHVQTQNWTAVVIDFVIVVLGVFIGLEVANWNAARTAEHEAHAYLVELREDFRGNLELSRSVEADHVLNIAAMLSLLEESAKARPESGPSSLNASFRRIQSMPTFTPVTRTYDNLVGSGDLKIIKSRDLQDALSRFNRQSGVMALVQNTHEQELVHTFQPYIIAHLDYAAVGYDRSEGAFPLRRAFDEEAILEVIDGREFRNVVIQKWTISVDLLNQTRTLQTEIHRILAIIETELAESR